MRMLYLTDLTPGLPPVDYLPDQLYHGLVTVLGAQNVIDYPSKPTYHMAKSDGRICRYQIEERHRLFNPFQTPDAFDIIVVSTPRYMSLANWLRLRHLKKPIIAVDGQDDHGITLPLLYDSILYFKREIPVPFRLRVNCYAPEGEKDFIEKYFDQADPGFLQNRDLAREVERKLCPISFSAEPELLELNEPKTAGLFFCGNPTHPLRKKVFEYFRRNPRPWLDVTEGHVGDRREYLKRLAAARIGLSLRGAGFDCVRYWEIPAAGTLLLSEPPDIAIHQNFTHGKNAVFFRDIETIVPMAETLLGNPGLVDSMTRRARVHIRRHHTTTARARYFLDEISNALGLRKTA